MSKTIVIVGNGKPDRNTSEAVDAADAVVRFGATPHVSSKMVGRRTTILTIRAFSLRDGHVQGRTFPCLCDADTVWVLDDANFKGQQQFAYEDEDAFTDRMQTKYHTMVAEDAYLRDKHVEFPSGNVRAELRELFRSRGFRDGTSSRTEPSAGVWVTVWVASLARYADWDVKLAGFAMEYPSHPKNYETDVLEQLRKEGRITMI